MNSVQQKISCVYVIGVTDQASTKRKQQTYKVTATKRLHAKSQADEIASAVPTEKLDGTCCFIGEFEGKPWLWARHDRKPNKAGERRFAQHKRNLADKEAQAFSWNPEKDFKEVPPNWIPASRLEVIDGFAMPDKLGHTPGWVPVELKSRPFCWHLSAVQLEIGLALVLRERQDCIAELVLKTEPLSNLLGQTCELIGTNINGNPYGFGTKKNPVHVLVPHGSMSVTCPSPVEQDDMLSWFSRENGEANIEGIVWHCTNGELYKLHRHHLNLPWPVSEPRISRCRVRVEVELTESGIGEDEGGQGNQQSDIFIALSSLNGQMFDSLKDLHLAIFPQNTKAEDP